MPYPSKTDRGTILAAAMDHLDRHGLRDLSLRSLAASLGITPNALYRYFADRAVLESALAGEVSRRLHAVMQVAVKGNKPEQAVGEIAEAYLAFAREHPNLYELLMLPCEKEGADAASHQLLANFVAEHVRALTGPEQVNEATLSLWAYLHGVAQLEATDVFDREGPKRTFEYGLRAWFMAASATLRKNK